MDEICGCASNALLDPPRARQHIAARHTFIFSDPSGDVSVRQYHVIVIQLYTMENIFGVLPPNHRQSMAEAARQHLKLHAVMFGHGLRQAV